ncbi:MaoC family dehydratase [Pseudomaricurvus alkylphenolicus]|jgi:acyl dehydratase|uniref:MaoC family dehydratase n=1 Tax=Pseudomaricurvus alkylphenolicus TaxID=1306991 RepID=UPI00142254CF|nr:MaoC family dehydratase [Pseudomaricurvus alkylphenolicus]NIB38023.1 MaoC family dehydratase [Pseudomaricurvus alkylphenolicus]
MIKIVKSKELPSLLGYQAEPTEWFEVTQDQINKFADTTLDHQFIHVDPAKAAETPFGGTIAHGFLTLSMISHFSQSFSVVAEDAVMGLNYGFDKVRFLTPVKVNSRIRAHAEVTEVTQKSPGQFLIRYNISIEIEGEDTPALIADWLGLLVVPV